MGDTARIKELEDALRRIRDVHLDAELTPDAGEGFERAIDEADRALRQTRRKPGGKSRSVKSLIEEGEES